MDMDNDSRLTMRLTCSILDYRLQHQQEKSLRLTLFYFMPKLNVPIFLYLHILCCTLKIIKCF
jgi:hypothetical protein